MNKEYTDRVEKIDKAYTDRTKVKVSSEHTIEMDINAVEKAIFISQIWSNIVKTHGDDEYVEEVLSQLNNNEVRALLRIAVANTVGMPTREELEHKRRKHRNKGNSETGKTQE